MNQSSSFDYKLMLSKSLRAISMNSMTSHHWHIPMARGESLGIRWIIQFFAVVFWIAPFFPCSYIMGKTVLSESSQLWHINILLRLELIEISAIARRKWFCSNAYIGHWTEMAYQKNLTNHDQWLIQMSDIPYYRCLGESIQFFVLQMRNRNVLL